MAFAGRGRKKNNIVHKNISIDFRDEVILLISNGNIFWFVTLYVRIECVRCGIYHPLTLHTLLSPSIERMLIFICMYTREKKTHTSLCIDSWKNSFSFSLSRSQIFVEHQKLVYYYSSVINIWVAMPKHHVVFVRMK